MKMYRSERVSRLFRAISHSLIQNNLGEFERYFPDFQELVPD
jgi:hypothetical protein